MIDYIKTEVYTDTNMEIDISDIKTYYEKQKTRQKARRIKHKNTNETYEYND